MRMSLYASWRAITLAAAVATILAGAAACGTASSGSSGNSGPSAPATPSANPLAGLTADRILTEAVADLKTASSVHVAGTVVDSGQTVTLDLTLGTKACQGTLGISSEGSFVMLKIGNELWLKPDDKFWKYAMGNSGSAVALDVVEGKWLLPSASDSSLGSLGEFCNPSQFAGLFSGKAKNAVKGPTATISGQPALEIKDTTGTGTAYVTLAAHPQFLSIASAGKGQLDFSRYNAPLTLTPPPADQTLDGSEYGF